MKHILFSFVLSGCLLFSHAYASNQSKPATNATRMANAQVYNELPFGDKSDYEDAMRGFVAERSNPKITGKKGNIVYDIQQFDFIKGRAPDTANPSFWRQSELNAIAGLFEVVPGIYQVRGWGLANISFIQGETGWIVIDPLEATESSAAALKLIQEKIVNQPVSAVIITHSHADHFAGIKGVVSQEDVDSGRVEIIAPVNFFEESVNENLIAGNHMGRRASYMYGNLLPKNETGTLGSGLGTTTGAGTMTIMEPTIEISKTPTSLSVDDVEMEFMYTPGAEAPTELMIYIPKYRALMQAEEINKTLHNLYTLRGAQARNGLKWSKYIHDVIENYGDDVEISFGSHHWPTWGNERIVKFWKGQRDTYRYIHDETLRLANQGKTILEVAEEVKLPESLSRQFANRGYYGSVNHNAKAQYQLYYGWFSGNPAELHELPPVAEGKKFVEYMGGADNILRKARADFEKGEYRWVATALNHVVFADPTNKQAKELLADTLEQLGYQAESGPWRNFYLSGAKELRSGVMKAATPNTLSPDIIKSLDLETYLDFLGVSLDHPKAAGTRIALNFVMPDTNQRFALNVENGVLNYTMGKQMANPQATITIDRSALDKINLRQMTFQDAIKSGAIKIRGDRAKFTEFLDLLDKFEFWVNIVTP